MRQNTPYAIETKNLSVNMMNKNILNNINIKIHKGVITAIMGPSGSGKTTLLRTFNRLIEIIDNVEITGELMVFGKSVFDMDVYQLRKLFGMVFQEPNPFPHLSIYKNIALGAKINGVAKTKRELDEIVKWSLEMVGLWDELKNRLEDHPWKLSGGQQQRLCLARALALRPKILLLDEPTANIDPINTSIIEDSLLRLVRDDDITVVIVTHMPQQAIRLSSYIIMMFQGRVIEEGPTSELALSPKHEITKKFLRGEV